MPQAECFGYTDAQWADIEAAIPLRPNSGVYHGCRSILERAGAQLVHGVFEDEEHDMRLRKIIGNKTDHEMYSYIEQVLHMWHLHGKLKFSRVTPKSGIPTAGGPLMRYLHVATDPVMDQAGRDRLKPDQLEYLVRRCRANHGLTLDFDDLDEWLDD